MSPVTFPETEPVKSTPLKGAQADVAEIESETDKEGEPTLTVTLSEAKPVGPVQVKVKVLAEVRFEAVSEPEIDLESDQAPEAEQELALVELQPRLTELP